MRIDREVSSMSARIGEPFNLVAVRIGVGRDGAAVLLDDAREPPSTVDGHLLQFVRMARAPPHGGERHDDGDEPILLLEGAIDILLDEGGPMQRTVELRAGQGFVVPRGVWRRLVIHQAAALVVMTPGPSKLHRPPR